MERLDFIEVQKHINILNVAYHLCLEIIETKGFESKAICPFCGYNKNTKIPTMSLNSNNNKYCCSRCGKGGYSVGLYATMKKIDTKLAFKELLERECFSPDRSKIQISPINLLADLETRDKVYRAFLKMLELERVHRNYLKGLGFLDSNINENLYRSIPKNKIKRRLICKMLSKQYNLCGIPGFYQEEDFGWTFSRSNGFFVPAYDENGYIQGLSIHLDKEFNNSSDIWFSSKDKINGTSGRNYIMKNNINENSKNLIITDNFLLGTLMKEIINEPMIAFQNITNSYMILKEIENTDIRNITFVYRIPYSNENVDYITRRVFSDLIPLGYNLNLKCIKDYKDFLNEKFDEHYAVYKAA